MFDLVVFLLLLFTLELASRLIYKIGDKIPQIAGGVQFVNYFVTSTKTFTGPYESRPYSLYWNRPNYSRKGFKQTDSNGFRWKGYDIKKMKPESTIRVLVYGGSTTFSNHNFWDPEKTWTFIAESMLNKGSRARKVELINAGLNYGTTAELLSHYMYEGHTFLPDYIMLHGPGNDMMPVSIGDTTFDYRITRESTNLYPRKFERVLLRFFGIFRILYAYWLRETVVARLEPESWDAPNIQNQRMYTEYPVQFFNNVLNLCKLAIANDSKIILVDYLQNHESEIERLKPGLSSGMVEIVRKMNFFFEETARKFEGNCSHIAIPNAKFYASDFTDTCHLTEIGEHKKAQIIASQLKELLD